MERLSTRNRPPGPTPRSPPEVMPPPDSYQLAFVPVSGPYAHVEASIGAESTRTADFSDDQGARDKLLKPGMEAQWCIFDSIIACVYGHRYLADGDPESLQLQIQATRRALSQLTPAGCRFPQFRCPESYFCENGEWIPNDITPLLWTQGNLWQALLLLEKSLAK